MTAHRPAGAVLRKMWTPAQVRALGVRTDLATLGSVLGISESAAREAYHAGGLPVPVVRVGRRLVVPVQPILELLGIAESGDVDRSHPPGLRVVAPESGPVSAAAGAGDAS